jgi:hypothetical protein
MRIVRIAQPVRTYPRYVAERREGRLKGQYPDEAFRHVPSLRRQWDRGGFGTGSRLVEVESDSPRGLIDELRRRGHSPAHDGFEFYEIRGPGAPRARIPIQRLFAMASGQA